jgi:hypothetical protein
MFGTWRLPQCAVLVICFWLACEPTSAGTTERMSVSSTETQTSEYSTYPAISAGGDLDPNGQDDLIAVYGGGLYVRYNNPTGWAWVNRHAPPIQDIAAGGLD